MAMEKMATATATGSNMRLSASKRKAVHTRLVFAMELKHFAIRLEADLLPLMIVIAFVVALCLYIAFGSPL